MEAKDGLGQPIILEPIYDINYNILCSVISEAWPASILHETHDFDTTKDFHNKCFNYLNTQFDIILSRCHPAAWILEGYRQIDMWTAVYREIRIDGIDFSMVPKNLAPVGRYGWRYTVEKASELLGTGEGYIQRRPNRQDLSDMFTVLFGLASSSESSNYLHYLRDMFESAYLVCSPFAISNGILLDSEDENKKHDNLINYLYGRREDKSNDPITPFQPAMIDKISHFLKLNFGFSFDEAKTIIDSTMDKICLPLGAGILVQPASEMVDIIAHASNLPLDTVNGFINFISLDTSNENYDKKNYLRKSQPIRMLNFCAIRLSLDGFHEAIYDNTSARLPSIKSAPSHLILSIGAAIEWLDMLVNKIASGQRQDLKSTKKLSEQLAAIEKFYHENIFEEQTKLLFDKKHIAALINLKKTNHKELPCGEIDVLAYDLINNSLFVIECKNIAPTTDARAAGQVLSDHFKQKNYHHKFNKKIKWVENNRSTICALFNEKLGKELPINFSIEPIFVTAYPSIVKFTDVEYNVMTFFELRSKLFGNGKY